MCQNVEIGIILNLGIILSNMPHTGLYSEGNLIPNFTLLSIRSLHLNLNRPQSINDLT